LTNTSLELKEEKTVIEYLEMVSLVSLSKIYREYGNHFARDFMIYATKLKNNKESSSNLRSVAKNSFDSLCKYSGK
jgi:hypothetical protein